jgi:NAD(P)-dependent dehydrogenase (short-subunit alcohol dehydrogenase family)
MDGDEGRGRIAVVVGGGAGIGEASSIRLAELGWKVVVSDINLDNAKSVAVRCKGHAQYIDIISPASIEDAAAEIEKAVGPVYGCVIPAAIFQEKMPPERFPVEAIDRILNANIRGTYLANVAFAKRMAARGEGAIVNFSSWNGHRSSPAHIYCASKAAVNLMTEGMAVEWGASGIRVNAITPGFVLVERMKERLRVGGRYSGNLDDISPLHKIVAPDEIAQVAAFLLSDRSSGMTGSNLVVDAGVMAASSWAIFGGVPPRRGTNAI